MNPLLTHVATEVAGEFGSKLSSILSPTRGRPEDARSRAIAMWLYRVMAPKKLSLTEVGCEFGRDRTTVRHALSRVNDWRETEPLLNERLFAVQQRIKARQ